MASKKAAKIISSVNNAISVARKKSGSWHHQLMATRHQPGINGENGAAAWHQPAGGSQRHIGEKSSGCRNNIFISMRKAGGSQHGISCNSAAGNAHGENDAPLAWRLHAPARCARAAHRWRLLADSGVAISGVNQA
jgi:hypothetical protein